MSRPGGDVVFDWRMSRQHGELTSLIEGFVGILQSDGYGAHAAKHPEVTWVGCWAHARRKFYEAYQAGEDGAVHYLVLIRELYAIEAEVPAEADDEAIATLREKRSGPVLDQIKQSLEQDRDEHLPKSAMAQAIGYAQSLWLKLSAFVRHGQTRIDNNLTEQAIRPTKLGAKNWLFIGHPDAGHRAAIIYTILEKCRRHKVEPLAYLDDVLRRLPGMTNHEVAEAKMTPPDWAKAHPVNTG